MDFGLKYEAVDIKAKYWSDTGKDWHRTGDPLKQDISSGRHQVLMHPIHWLGKGRTIFFLSTARVGSKWAAKAISDCTGVSVEHEWTLNHRQRNGVHVQEKITTLDNAILSDKRSYATKLLEYSSRYHSNLKKDRIEFNVYLSEFLPELHEVFPNAEFYGLTRNAENVIASLFSRDWYATKNSVRHPCNKVYNSRGLNQLQKIATYWAETNGAIKKSTNNIFKIENIGQSKSAFIRLLEDLQLPVHPRLIENLKFIPIDSTEIANLTYFNSFKKHELIEIAKICNPELKNMGYPVIRVNSTFFVELTNWNKNFPSMLVKLIKFGIRKAKKINLLDFSINNSDGVVVKKMENNDLKIQFEGGIKTGWLTFSSNGKASWSDLSTGEGLSPTNFCGFIDGAILFSNDSNALCRVFLLGYSSQSKRLTEKRILTLLTPGWRGRFSEILRADKRYVMGFYFSQMLESEQLSGAITISSASFNLEKRNWLIH